MADPGYYILQRTVLDARYYLSPQESKHILNHLAVPTKLNPEVGPCSVLLARLNQIGWHWDNDVAYDQWDEPCDLWETPIQALTTRLMEAWQLRSLRRVSKRQTFPGLQNASVTLTLRKLTKSPCERGLMHRCLNGTFFTADHAKHMPTKDGEPDTKCPFCGEPDNILHRHWECRELEPARLQCPQEVRQQILAMEPATYNHGWIPSPPTLREYKSTLKELPDTTDWHNLHVKLPHTLDLFTDGSCKSPHDCLSRLASWGVACYTPEETQEFTPISGGVVPGIIQTTTRAEFMATCSAVKFAIKMKLPFRLWVDNQQVWKTLTRTLHATHEPYQVTNKVKNHDLINELGTLMYIARQHCQHVVKVCSHQTHGDGEPWETRWSWRGNDAADHVAARAVHEHPRLLQLWHALVEEIASLEQIRDHLHNLLTAVGYLAQQKTTDQKTKQTDPDLAEPVEFRRPYVSWTIPAAAPDDDPQLQCPDLEALHTWSMTLNDGVSPTRWWTWQQLFIDARFQHPQIGPWYDQPNHTWRAGAVCPPHTFSKRVRWFLTYINKLVKSHKTTIPLKLSRPDSHVYAFWTKTLPVRIPQERCDKVDQWLMEWGTMKAHKDHNRISRLP